MNNKWLAVKKSGSLESASDRSISNEMLAVTENKPNARQQTTSKRTAITRNDTAKTGICKARTVAKTNIKTPDTSKASTVNKSAKMPVNANSRIQSPKVRTNSTTTKLTSRTKETDGKTPRKASDVRPESSPSWKVPSANTGTRKTSPIKAANVSRQQPGRGTMKKQRKVYNPPSLYCLCKDALAPLISPPEVNEEAKDFLKRRLYSQTLLGTIWLTLTTETKSNRITKDALISERDVLWRDLSELQATLDTRISTIAKQHEEVLSTTTTSLVSNHLTQTKQIKEQYEHTILDLRSQLSVKEDCYKTEVSDIRDRHAKELSALHTEHKQQQNQLIAAHNDNTSRLESVQHDLEEQNEYLDGQLREKDENIQAEISSQVQREVARYSTINAELQSLRDVIDMRNGEIKKQQTRLAELTLKAEEVAGYKHEVQALRDQNEQLRATINVKTEAERNLNLTQENLYQSIKVKENESKHMVLKCEELQFRLSLLEEEHPPNTPPLHFSTPTSSPMRKGAAFQDSPFRHDVKSKSQVRLFDGLDGQTQVLPLHE